MTSSCRPASALLAALAGFLPACGGATSVPANVERPEPAQPAVSTWSYHPTSPRHLLARIDLGKASWLLVGRGGERWVVDVREGTASAAPMLADQDLVGVSRPDATTFAFVGAEGAIYSSPSPLGPLTLVRRMEPLPLRIAAAGRTIVAVHWDGSVVQSTDAGKTFSPVDLRGGRPYDVTLAPDGRAMVLGFPEQLWVSRAQGAWKPAGTPPVGAGFVGMDAGGALIAQGIRASVLWGERDADPQIASRAFEPPPMDLMTDLEAGPSAAAITSGRATISDGRYYEVARQEEKGPWFLGQGALTDRVFWAPIAQSDDCRHLFVGARGKRLAFGCLTGARKGGVLFPSLRVIQSRDGGSSFVRQPTVLVGDEEGLSLTVLDDDSLVVAGACKPDSTGVCVPGAPVRLLPSAEGKSLRFTATEPSEVPALRGRVTQVVASGGRLYATGLQATGRPAVLVSVDKGETFRAVKLDLSGTDAAGDGDGEALLQRMQPGKLVAGAEDKLSWVLHTDQGPVWVVLDKAGRVLSARLTPATHPLLAAAGTRAIAIGAEDGTVMESSNGGETFERLTRLPSFLWDKDAGPVAWCEKDGCVVGDAFSRSGWTDKNGGMVGWPEPVKPVPADAPQRTPIVCKVVETVTGVIENTLDMPDAADAGRGAVGWSTVVVDRKTASVSVMHATTGSGHAVKPVVLLPPAPNPMRVALEARTQAEGAAALRYGFAAGPDGKPLVGSPVRIEVAWDNQFEGSPQRAQLTSTTPLRAADVTSLSGNVAAQANVGMLSVVPGGIHVCPHAVCDPASEPSFFLRNRGGVETVAPVPWPTQGLGGALPLSRHLMRVDGKNVPIAVHQQRSVVMRANLQQDGTYTYEALALAPSDARELGIQELSSWAYLSSTTMGLSRTLYHPDKGHAHAWVLRFDTDQGVGKTVEAPTQRDLSDPPVPCTEAQRTGSFRVLSPGMAGTEHPVILEHGERKAVLRTRLAVLYGSPSSACVDVFDASADRASDRRALIPVGGMDRSWLLSREGSTLRWWGLRCQFQPGAKVDPPTKAAVEPTPANKASDENCTEIFNKIATFMGAPSMGDQRDSFLQMCRGRSVDMECVRRAANVQELVTNCLKL